MTATQIEGARPAPSAPTTAGRVVLETVVLGLMSLVMSANGNAMPQTFFMRHAPENKSLYLSVCLFGATVAAIGGVLTSRRVRASRAAVLALLLATIAAECSLLFVAEKLVFIALAAFAQFGANFLTNYIDHLGAAAAGSKFRRLYDASSTVARLGGMVSAPIFFTRFFDSPPLVIALMGSLTVLAVPATMSLLGDGDRHAEHAPVVSGGGSLDRADRLFFAYVIAMYASMILFAADLIYVLRDLVHLADAGPRGGLSITEAFLGALLVNALGPALSAFRRKPAAATVQSTIAYRPRVARLLAPAFTLSLGAGALASGMATVTPGRLAAGALAIGASYGLFLGEVRDYTSRGARDGRTALLTLFNNMTNFSSVLAFGILLTIAALGLGSPAATSRAALLAVAVVASTVVPLLILSVRERGQVLVS